MSSEIKSKINSNFDFKPDSALILAAGFGTRLGKITKNTPKCLLEVAGMTVLEHAVQRAACALEGNEKGAIYVNTHYLAESVECFTRNINSKNEIILVHEERILETGGAIKNLCKAKGNNEFYLLVHNADAFFYGAEFIKDFTSQYRGQDFFLAIVPKSSLAISEQGDFEIDASGALRFKKGGSYVFSGLCIVNTKRFAEFPKDIFSSTEIMRLNEKEIEYYVLPPKSSWIDIGTPKKLEYAKNLGIKSAMSAKHRKVVSI